MIEKAAQDRRLAKAHVTVQMGGAQAAVAFYKNASTPNLIIIESLLDRSDMLGELDRLAEVCDPGTKVIAIGHVNDVLLYRELLRRGVSEYVVAPVKVMQIIESISAIYTDPETGPVGQVIAFVGAKGGSGSSTVCHNTAFAMASALKSDVVIADFDLPFGTAGLDFNQDPLAGHRRRPGLARAPRRDGARPAAVALLGSFEPVRRARAPSTVPTISIPPPARPCSTSCARTCPGSPLTCRICGPPGRSRSCSGPITW